MKKLKLAIDQLAVESFPSTDVPEERGTVRGNDVTNFDCEPTTDRYDRNCASEILSCMQTCNPPCVSSFTCPECP